MDLARIVKIMVRGVKVSLVLKESQLGLVLGLVLVGLDIICGWG